jgi:hypothetical protein
MKPVPVDCGWISFTMNVSPLADVREPLVEFAVVRSMTVLALALVLTPTTRPSAAPIVVALLLHFRSI